MKSLNHPSFSSTARKVDGNKCYYTPVLQSSAHPELSPAATPVCEPDKFLEGAIPDPRATSLVSTGALSLNPAHAKATPQREKRAAPPTTDVPKKFFKPAQLHLRDETEPLLLTVYPETIAEGGLKGCLTAYVSMLPTAEELQIWFNGVPHVPELPTMGSPIVQFVDHMKAIRKYHDWQYSNHCLKLAIVECGIRDFRTAATLQVRSQAVLVQLRTYIEKFLGPCTTAEQALYQMTARRKQAHPDRFCLAYPDDPTEQVEVRALATGVFQMLGSVAEVLRDNPDFGERLFPGSNVKVWNNTVLRQAFPEGVRLITLGLNRLFVPLVGGLPLSKADK
jgi:hypothetical protein